MNEGRITDIARSEVKCKTPEFSTDDWTAQLVWT